MVTLVVFHDVHDYETWKPVFDDHEAVRASHGEVEHRVYRNVQLRNRVIVHNDFPDEAAARAFMADPSLPAAMERAGLAGEPWLGLIEQLERRRHVEDEVAVTLVVHHKVRDYATWKPVFDEHEGVRRGHGAIEHRLYRALDNPNALVIHNDFPSIEAAEAFGKDPSLPDAMERGGVEGEPSIGLLTRSERKVYGA
jgi:quinol monooxygenase YgiN